MERKHVTYESLKQAASHYRGETNYCTVIAAALILGWKFGKARAEWERRGRRTGRGTYFPEQLKLLNDHGVTLEPVAVGGGTLKTVSRKLSRYGTFLVYSRSHVSVVRNGTLEDWATDSRKRVIRVYEVFYN
jgi:hypothetical protein